MDKYKDSLENGQKTALNRMPSFSEQASSLSIRVGGEKAHNPTMQNLLKALFPHQAISYSSPDFNQLDIYMFVHEYRAEEPSHARDYVKKAQRLLSENQLKEHARVLILLYENVKVAFPERKLRNEKAISAIDTEDILEECAKAYKERIRVLYEFGLYDLKDTLFQLKKAQSIYVDMSS
ncbi:hypothetical protein [Candidatus Protochlamydia phocaeensis]|uniref:hypothetical protein n=1 Tax=Candidatus Protochlamydia phocaeensis TaxID=1414722 RepID=UPI0008383061|nr:hypothetical protein [Candidatus Protochlamydia phocaeensis]